MTAVMVGIPWRPSRGRWVPFALLQEWYATHFPDWHVHTADADPNGDGFSLSRSRNDLAYHASRYEYDVVILNDADTIPEPEPLRQAVRLALEHNATVLPYTEYRSMRDDGTAMHLRGVEIDQCPHFTVPFATSGVYVTTPSAWWSVGGQDERFVGWGPEDMAWLVAYRILRGEEPLRVEGKVFGLGHPTAVKEGPQYEANVALYQRYLAAGDAGDVEAVRDLAFPGL